MGEAARSRHRDRTLFRGFPAPPLMTRPTDSLRRRRGRGRWPTPTPWRPVLSWPRRWTGCRRRSGPWPRPAGPPTGRPCSPPQHGPWPASRLAWTRRCWGWSGTPTPRDDVVARAKPKTAGAAFLRAALGLDRLRAGREAGAARLVTGDHPDL